MHPGNYGNVLADRADWFHTLNKDELALADYRRIQRNEKAGPFMWEKELRASALLAHRASGKLDVDDYVFQGRQLIRDHRNDEAGASFDMALSLDKDNVAARLGKIQLAMWLHDGDPQLIDAAAKFDELLRDHPDWSDYEWANYELYRFSGRLHARMGQNAQALRDYGRCKELSPGGWDNWSQKQMDDVVHAMNVSQGKLTLEDYCELTNNLYMAKKYEEALEQSAKAIEFAPTSLLAYINHKELAKICFDNVRESPRFLRIAYEDTKKLAELQPKGYAAEFEKTKEWVVWHCVNQASNLKAKEKFDEAQEYLELAVEAIPNDVNASKDLASVKQAREDHLHPPEAAAAKEPAAEAVQKEVHTYVCPQCNGTKIIDVISDVFHPDEVRRAIVRDAAPEGFWREKVIRSGWHPNEKHMEICPTCKGLGYIKVEE